MRHFAIAAAMMGFAATTLPASAESWSTSRLSVPHGEWLSHTQIGEKLTSQGYKVYEIEADDGAYEVKMTDKNGVRIEAYVHPATGEILPGYDD